MKVTVEGCEIHVSTGGRDHVEGRPFLVFLHGSGFNHFTWILQTRALAYDNYNVIAADMPGHGLSKGAPVETIEGQGEWVIKLLDVIGVKQASLIAHSQGGLIALEIAKAAPERVNAIAFIASAASIPVNPQLVEQAQNDPEAAYANMVSWALGGKAHMYDHTVPGNSHPDCGFQIMRMSSRQALVTDLKACVAYEGGQEAATKLECPVICIFARQDRMTPLKSGQFLADQINHAEVHIISDSGHTLPSEKPRQVNKLLRKFLKNFQNRRAA